MSDEVKAEAAKESAGRPNKLISAGIIVFCAVEALIAFFVVLKPLFIDVVYHNSYLDEQGIAYSVSLFGNMFSSGADSGVVKLSLAGAVGNLALLYLVITAAPAALALFLLKGYAFAKSGLVAVFGLKAVAGLMPILVPFANVKSSMKAFGAADAAICLAVCGLFAYLGNAEYADDMLFDGEQKKAMTRRGKFGGLLLLMMTALMICESFAMGGYGINWSIIIGKSDRELMQGYILTALLAFSIIAAVLYYRGTESAMYFFAGFGGAAALVNIYALINKIIWVNTTYKQQKALKNQGDEAAAEWIGANGMGVTWWRRTIFMIACLLIAGAVAFFSFMKIRRKLFGKTAAEEKKPALMTRICAGALVVFFVLSIIAVLKWDKKIYDSFVMGAMDYMYLIAFGGITLFLALSLLGGCAHAKWGALALYIIAGAANFSTIFRVFAKRNSMAAQYPGYHGYDFIITGILLIISVICCFSVIILFAYKKIDDYMYNKSNS